MLWLSVALVAKFEYYYCQMFVSVLLITKEDRASCPNTEWKWVKNNHLLCGWATLRETDYDNNNIF